MLGMDQRVRITIQLFLLLVVGSALGFSPLPHSISENGRKLELAFAAENYLSATELLIDLAVENPWWSDLWETAGETAYLAGDLRLAEHNLEIALEQGALSLDGQILLGEVYNLLGEPENAVETWQQLSASPPALEKLAQLHERNGDIATAIEVWNSYLTLTEEGVDPELIYHLGLLIAADAPPKALPYLDQSRLDFPDADKVGAAIREAVSEEPAYQYVSAGQVLASIDQWNLAAYAFEKATVLREDYQEAWIYWGEALQHIDDPGRDILEVLETGLALNQDSPLANLFLGIYWQRQGSHPTALEYFETVETAWPDNPDVLVESGKSLAALAELEEALSKYQAAVELKPLEAIYYIQMAEFCVEYAYQVYEVGLPAARIAVQFNPDDPRALDLAGQVMAALDDHMNALSFYQRALNADPAYAPAHFHLGIYYITLEDRDPAVYHLQQALENTANPALIDQIERLLSNYR